MPAPSPAEETSRGPLGATAAVRAAVAGAGARGSQRARPGRKLMAPSWWSARAVRPGAPVVFLAAAKRLPVAEGARVPRWRHGPSHSRPWEEWSRTSRRTSPQRPLRCRRAQLTRLPTNASPGRTRARSIVAGRLITRLAALPRYASEVRGSREGKRPSLLEPAMYGGRAARCIGAVLICESLGSGEPELPPAARTKAHDARRLLVGRGSSVGWRTMSLIIGSVSRSYTNQLAPSAETTASRGFTERRVHTTPSMMPWDAPDRANETKSLNVLMAFPSMLSEETHPS